jgi:SAM-dependent methyltransferase
MRNIAPRHDHPRDGVSEEKEGRLKPAWRFPLVRFADRLGLLDDLRAARDRWLEWRRERSLSPTDRAAGRERRAELLAAERWAGRSIPPATDRFLVIGTTRIDTFLESGRMVAERLAGVLAESLASAAPGGVASSRSGTASFLRGFFGTHPGGIHSTTAHADGAVQQQDGSNQPLDALDFGAGCGRVLRHLVDRIPARWSACDINPRLVRSLRRVMAGRGGASASGGDHADDSREERAFGAERSALGDIMVSPLAPPAPFASESFELITAFSVLTHLGPELQRAWLADWSRMLRPGGVILATFHGPTHARILSPVERAAFGRDELVVRPFGPEGSNGLSSFSSRAALASLLPPGLTLMSVAPGADHPWLVQEIALIVRN